MKPEVLIATGLGINSEEELGKVFKNAGAHVKYKHLNELIEEPSILDDFNGFGFPGGFMMGDHLGAGQSTKNGFNKNGFIDKFKEKLDDKKYPMINICNSAQVLCKADLLPIKVGTVKNDTGKHETGIWDYTVNPNNDSVWLKYLKQYSGPIFAPISHGEGNFRVDDENYAIALEKNLIALEYTPGYMNDYFKSSRKDRYNPNGSSHDIAGFGWNNNLVLFPHFERLLMNNQVEDIPLVDAKISEAPRGMFEPTYLLFKSAVDFMYQNM